DPTNTLVLSVVSAWEITIKLQLGKLKLALPIADVIASQQQFNQFEILPVNLSHVLALEDLPGHHQDPFDRLLIAQANVEDLVLVSRDAVFKKYKVKTQW